MKSAREKEGKYGILSYTLYLMFHSKFKGADKRCEANVEYAKWLRICKKFNERKFNSIIKGSLFKLPYRLGTIGIVQFVKKIRFKADGTLYTKNLMIDWPKSKALWNRMYPDKTVEELKLITPKPIVYITNEHSDGRIFRYFWKKRTSNVKNKEAYEFIPAMRYRKLLTAYIINNPGIQYCEKF